MIAELFTTNINKFAVKDFKYFESLESHHIELTIVKIYKLI
jgi:hypothetical protein